jgi:hypothetical protein
MKKPQKHPSKMTTSEAIEHLFHPKVAILPGDGAYRDAQTIPASFQGVLEGNCGSEHSVLTISIIRCRLDELPRVSIPEKGPITATKLLCRETLSGAMARQMQLGD